jgi:ParB-like chromosome segregation protein Spo0J
MKIETVKTSSLVLDSKNARKHDEKNLAAIKNSLQSFGQRKPIVITETNIVVAGNGTLQAALDLQWTEIEVVRIPKDWTEKQITAFALADNRTAELAEWDDTILAETLLNLDDAGWDIKTLGFNNSEIKPESSFDTTPQNIKERFEVVIECDNENDQTALLIRLSEEGLKVRAIVI